jgi:hypothetical protein
MSQVNQLVRDWLRSLDIVPGTMYRFCAWQNLAVLCQAQIVCFVPGTKPSICAWHQLKKK